PVAADPSHVDVEQHGAEDGRPQDDVEGEGVYADEGEAVAQHPQHGRADQPADDGAGAARQRRAPDYARSDRQEHDLVSAGLRVERGDAEALQDSGQAGEHASDDEVADLEPVDVDARFLCPDRVGAGGDGVEAPAGMAEYDMHDEYDEHRPADLAIAPIAHDRGEGG